MAVVMSARLGVRGDGYGAYPELLGSYPGEIYGGSAGHACMGLEGDTDWEGGEERYTRCLGGVGVQRVGRDDADPGVFPCVV
jgi:hypothetical protein